MDYHHHRHRDLEHDPKSHQRHLEEGLQTVARSRRDAAQVKAQLGRTLAALNIYGMAPIAVPNGGTGNVAKLRAQKEAWGKVPAGASSNDSRTRAHAPHAMRANFAQRYDAYESNNAAAAKAAEETSFLRPNNQRLSLNLMAASYCRTRSCPSPRYTIKPNGYCVSCNIRLMDASEDGRPPPPPAPPPRQQTTPRESSGRHTPPFSAELGCGCGGGRGAGTASSQRPFIRSGSGESSAGSVGGRFSRRGDSNEGSDGAGSAGSGRRIVPKPRAMPAYHNPHAARPEKPPPASKGPSPPPTPSPQPPPSPAPSSKSGGSGTFRNDAGVSYGGGGGGAGNVIDEAAAVRARQARHAEKQARHAEKLEARKNEKSLSREERQAEKKRAMDEKAAQKLAKEQAKAAEREAKAYKYAADKKAMKKALAEAAAAEEEEDSD